MSKTVFQIIETKGRQQPFAIWCKGEIWRFCETATEANAYIFRQYRRLEGRA